MIFYFPLLTYLKPPLRCLSLTCSDSVFSLDSHLLDSVHGFCVKALSESSFYIREMEQIELTGEGGQSKRSRNNLNQKASYETNNEADGRKIIILNNKKYLYEKCNRVIKNVIGNQHANVNRAKHVKGKRPVHGDYERNVLDLTNEVGHSKRNRKNSYPKGKITILDNKEYIYQKCDHRIIENVIGNRHVNVNRAQPVRRERLISVDHDLNGLDQTRNKRLKEIPAKHEKYGPVISNRFDRVPEYTMNKEVKGGKQKDKFNELHEKNIKVKEKNSDDDTSTEVEILDSDDDTFTEVGISDSDDDTSTDVETSDSDDDTSTEVEILDSDDEIVSC